MSAVFTSLEDEAPKQAVINRDEIPRRSQSEIADLIQVECLMFRTSCLKLTSEGREGAIYFSDGKMVHAQCPDRVGVDAVYEMILWDQPMTDVLENEPCSGKTIQMPWEGVLLEAVSRLDEFIGEEMEDQRKVESNKVITLPFKPEESRLQAVADKLQVPEVVRFASDGSLVAKVGKADEGFQGDFRKVMEEVDGITRLLGGFGLREMHFEGAGRKCVCVVGELGDIAGVMGGARLDSRKVVSLLEDLVR